MGRVCGCPVDTDRQSDDHAQGTALVSALFRPVLDGRPVGAELRILVRCRGECAFQAGQPQQGAEVMRIELLSPARREVVLLRLPGYTRFQRTLNRVTAQIVRALRSTVAQEQLCLI